MSLQTKLMLAVFVCLAFGLVMAILNVLSAWNKHHVSRHKLIVQSKTMRRDYQRALARRQAGDEEEHADGNASVIIEDAAQAA